MLITPKPDSYIIKWNITYHAYYETKDILNKSSTFNGPKNVQINLKYFWHS